MLAPVLVGVATLLAPMVGYSLPCSSFFVCSTVGIFERNTLTPARKRVRARWKLALRWPDQFHFQLVILATFAAAPAGWREVIMVSIAVAACLISPRQIHRANEFTLAPIKEAAWIFLGIFGTIIPVLDYMAMHAVQLGLRSDLQFY